uniref:G-protein coupled receptors family 1 profile domain-containing protein n=1 Tax=Acanthochromis polyacanthus TaxID=80966 RepID=A0A3Q1F3B8_9TELE
MPNILFTKKIITQQQRQAANYTKFTFTTTHRWHSRNLGSNRLCGCFINITMQAELNITYITLGGHVEGERYRYLYVFIMFNAYILIICCNASIVCVIVFNKSLHELTYVFIAALLLNSILYSTSIHPKLLIDFLSEISSEFFLLSAMAYDRYVSICKPLQYPNIMRKSTVMASAAIINNLQLCRFTLTGIFCNNSIYILFCVIPRTLSINGVSILLNTVLLPMLFILFTYARILIISYQSGRDVRKKTAQTCFPHLLVLMSISCFSSYDIIIARLQFYFHSTARFIMTLKLIIYHPLFNPIIYGVKMKEISKHLKKLLCEGKLN